MKASIRVRAALALSFAIGCLGLSACGEQMSVPGVKSANAADAPVSNAPPPPDVADINRLIAASGVTKDGGAVRQASTVEKSISEKALFVNGWNTLQISYCVGTNVYGQDYLTVYMRDGTVIFTPSIIAVAVLAPACVASSSVAIWVTSTNGYSATWSHALTYRN